MRRVAVVGAGVAGLVAARALVAAGADVVVLEAGEAAGGHARTGHDAGFTWEWGPQTLTARARTALLEALAVGVRPVAAAGPGTRLLYRGGRLHALPHGPLGLLRSRALSLRGWLRLLAEPLRRGTPVPGESVEAFFTRRIGAEAARYLAGAFVSGIHAGDPAQLCAEEAFPTLVGWERDAGSLLRGALAGRRALPAPEGAGADGATVAAATQAGEADARTGAGGPPARADDHADLPRRGVVTLPGGLGGWTAAMAQGLGARLRLATPVRALHRAGGWVVETDGDRLEVDRVVLATPPGPAAALLRGLDDGAADALAGIPMARLAVVHRGGPDGPGPQGFGALVPRGEGVRTLGLLFLSSQAPDRAPPGGWLHSSFIGGATDPEALDLPDDALLETAAADTAALTGWSAAPTFARVVRHEAAIPQLVAGHRARVARADRFDGLALAGNYTCGVSVEDAARSGRLAAARVLG